MAINVAASPMVVTTSWKMPILSHTPPAARSPELDQELDLGLEIDSGDGVSYTTPFIPGITCTLLGDWKNVGASADNILGLTLSITAVFYKGQVWDVDPLEITFSPGESWAYTERLRKNWVKWSNIGSLDFTIWKDNIAGERPMDWKGWVYAILKRGAVVVVYGENGVSILSPSGNAWGLKTIHRIGLKGPGAVCGNVKNHFFVDAEGRLFHVGEDIKELGYSEYLSTLSSGLRMSWDDESELVYICDGEYGYLYSHKDKSMGEGPVNITGLGYQGGSLYVAASEAISTPTFEICTDIYDFGTRAGKTIRLVQLGTDLNSTLSVAIDYRRDKSEDWSTTEWRTVNAEGVAKITCYGNEFRFKVKSSAYEYFELDYITIQGEVHDY